MKMEYSELKERFADFHAEKITKSELISAIGLYQRMNNINIPGRVSFFGNGYKKERGKYVLTFFANCYFPRNISPRIIGHDLDRDYEIENMISSIRMRLKQND